jgi:hypothetical protein
VYYRILHDAPNDRAPSMSSHLYEDLTIAARIRSKSFKDDVRWNVLLEIRSLGGAVMAAVWLIWGLGHGLRKSKTNPIHQYPITESTFQSSGTSQ